MEVNFIDTTFRDGSQSLWASSIRTGMMEAVAEEMDQVGFSALEVPVIPIYFKKIVRDLKEDPWAMARMLGEKIPNTVKSCMTPSVIHPFEPSPLSIVKLFYETLARTGALNRVQIMGNTMDQTKRSLPWMIPFFRNLNMEIAIALAYTISPYHTEDYYGKKTRELASFKPDVIYLKDQGGLLTPDSLRRILPDILANANGIPVEVHSHNTTGLADVVYMEALKLGVRVLHTAVPPLANGSSQPNVLNVARNIKNLGYTTNIDEERLVRVSQQLTAFGKEENMPYGTPLEYNVAQYMHQVPGGVISNLWHQLKELQLEERINEVLEESIQVRKDLGYPIMITPFSQFVVTQSALNVATGERYKVVLDELILFAMGGYGEDSNYAFMDQNLRDRFLYLSRAKELRLQEKDMDVPLKDIRESLGGPNVSDEEILLRYIMKGEHEIKAMRAAGPPKQYTSASSSLVRLIDELGKKPNMKYINLQNNQASLKLKRS